MLLQHVVLNLQFAVKFIHTFALSF